MTKPTLIIIHGMGTHTAESFKEEVVSSINAAYATYPSFVGRNIEEIVDIVSVSYDDIFEEYRTKVAEDSTNISSILSAITPATNLSNLVNFMTDFTTNFSEDSLFYTHWLDVLLYRFTTLGEEVRIRIGKAVNEQIINKGASFVHILGHSLGTAVLHDALASRYLEGYELGETTDALSPSMHKLKSVHMMANVGRVLETIPKLNSSIVRPLTGCTSYYREYRHRFDPFTWVKPFNPVGAPWSPNEYVLTKIDKVTQIDTHDIKHYLRNPHVHRMLLSFVDSEFCPTDNDVEVAEEAFLDETVSEKYVQLIEYKDQVELNNADSVINFVDAVIAFKAYVNSLGDEFIGE